ncbi:MAG: tetraacyldisaccharide 4'-kinase [Chitinophagales bacterium]|nr:tetraacyldisaccharide 4'-kinase [Chitinophagales bacterium]MCO5280539.1 tetraacyldisaccharide 4'-kinase [Chitinophagales bacterium]
MKKILLALPAFVFWCITELRNYFFDKKVIKRVTFQLPLIGIGNLNMGGTGKSPLVEWLLENFSHEFKMAVLSRGYGRKSRGFQVVETTSNYKQSGDEPLLFKWKFSQVPVCLSEDRVVGVPMLLGEFPETEAIILDDVFQHRAIKPGLMLLTTEYENLFTRDSIFPLGWLREDKKNYHRADIILVTKCPENLSQQEADKIRNEINPFPYQQLYFTAFEYGQLNELNNQPLPEKYSNVLLLTGIANAKPLQTFFEKFGKTVFEMNFADHHSFSKYNLEQLHEMKINLPPDTIIVTTEKDAVRLIEFKEWFVQNKFQLFIQPVRHHFLFNAAQEFSNNIRTFIQATTEKNS